MDGLSKAIPITTDVVAHQPLATSGLGGTHRWLLLNGRCERATNPPYGDYKNQRSPSPHREAIKYRLGGSPLIGPEKRKKKAIRTARCLSVASFGLFRFFLSIAGIGQSSGSPFLGYLFWRSKKGNCPRGISGKVQEQRSSFHQRFDELSANGVAPSP